MNLGQVSWPIHHQGLAFLNRASFLQPCGAPLLPSSVLLQELKDLIHPVPFPLPLTFCFFPGGVGGTRDDDAKEVAEAMNLGQVSWPIHHQGLAFLNRASFLQPCGAPLLPSSVLRQELKDLIHPVPFPLPLTFCFFPGGVGGTRDDDAKEVAEGGAQKDPHFQNM
ncbi:hypothetical protein SKAU_G00384650 [Synaphobranchus kaupii]|uniref:Uncharacterized protein n=1 Tax=Synaphobranchus kaupii TaxID=118154 RepID=A0A9Q1IE63_SYNKA|nr:hypothetical protein SKAU_G00384650 [Synaphobranchus kaupii]